MVTVDGRGGFVALAQPRPDLLGFRCTQVGGRPAIELLVPDEAAAQHRAAVDVALAETAHVRLGDVLTLPDVEDEQRWSRFALRLDGGQRAPARLQLVAEPSPEGDAVLMHQAEVVAQMGSWRVDVASGALRWSDNHFRIYGLEPGAIEPTLEYVVARAHPDDRDRVARGIEAMRTRGSLDPMTYRIVLDDGTVRHLRATLGVVESAADGRPLRLVGAVQDRTAQRRAEQEISAHVAVSESLAAWEGLEPGAERLLGRLAAAMDCAGGVFWTPDDGHLVARVVWQDATGRLDAYAAATRVTRVRRGLGVVGAAWQQAEPVIAAEPPGPGDGPRWQAARVNGIRGVVAIPAICGEAVLAVVELPFRDETEIGDRLLRSLTGIAHELGQFLGRRRGQLEAARLTARELEVLQLAARGLTTRATAEALVVSPATVKTHLAHIYAKLGATDRASAVAMALRLGVIA